MDASQVVWTDRTCRKCYNTGSTVLDEMSPYCVDCRLLILEHDKATIQNTKKDEVDLKKEIRWLQKWIIVSDVTRNSALVSWLQPEFVNDNKLFPDTYYLFSKDYSINETTDSFTRQVLLENLSPSTTYELILSAYIDDQILKKTLKTKFSTSK